MKPTRVIFKSKKTGKMFSKKCGYGWRKGKETVKSTVVAVYSTSTGREIA